MVQVHCLFIGRYNFCVLLSHVLACFCVCLAASRSCYFCITLFDSSFLEKSVYIWFCLNKVSIFDFIHFPTCSLDAGGKKISGSLTCFHSMIISLNTLECLPCSGFVKKLSNISHAEKESILKLSLSCLSITKKYLIQMWK